MRSGKHAFEPLAKLGGEFVAPAVSSLQGGSHAERIVATNIIEKYVGIHR